MISNCICHRVTLFMPVPYQLKYSNMFHFVQDLFTYICDQLVFRFLKEECEAQQSTKGKLIWKEYKHIVTTCIRPVVDSVIMGNIIIEVDKK